MKVGFGTDAAPEPGAPSAQASFTPPAVTELAKLFPQLQIVELVGRGGMGAVYRAKQPALNRWVALKVLPPQSTQRPGFAERFMREARALARLNHPSIVAVHEFGEAGGTPYFVMEFVEGVTLRRLVQQRRLGPREALQIVPQICEALQYAHDEGVVHRDIKPENILIDRKGRVKIADFGIAKIVAGDQVQQALTEGQVLGTPHYMAPEQIEHPQAVDHRADIFSLGVVFYELLTGELPLGKFAPPSRKVEVDVRLDEVVLRALEKEPEHRYQHASEIKTAVETITGAGAAGASAAAGSARTRLGELGEDSKLHPAAPCGRHQFGLMPNLLPGERVLHFQKRLGATLWKSLPTYRFNVSWPPLSEVELYVTDRRVIVLTNVLRLVTNEFSMWFRNTAPGAASEVFKRVTLGQSRWFGPYLELISEHPEKRWYRSRELRLRLFVREPEVLETLISSASSEAQAAPEQPQQSVRRAGATPKLFPSWLVWVEWTARILGTLILLTFASFVLAEGLPPFARQPGGVQLTSAGGLLIALGFVVGWWRGGTAAMLIGAGWALIRASENAFQVTTPFEVILLVGLLYAVVWWGRHGRRTILAAAVTTALATALLLGRLLLPTNVRVEGRIADAVTHQPIPNAELVLVSKLTSPEGRHPVPNARATVDGRFSLHVGWYAPTKLVRVSAPGYRTRQDELGFRAVGQRCINREYALLPDQNSESHADLDDAAVRREALPQFADLPQGSLELVGLSYYPAINQLWWRRDGSPCAESFIITQPHLGTMPDKAQVRAIVLRAQGLPPGSSWPSWKIQSAYGSADAHVCRSDGQEDPMLRVVLAGFWPSAEQLDLKIGVASAPWQQVAESGPTEAAHATHLAIPDAEVSFLKGAEEDQESSITIVHNLLDREIRVLAVKQDGKEIIADRTGTRWSEKFCTTTARFAGLRLAEINRFRLEARPYEWVEFPDVPLSPVQIGGFGADVANVVAEEKRANADPNQRFFLIGPKPGNAPATNGHPLLLVLPGGVGGPDFLPFVKRIYQHAVPAHYLVANLIAPQWDENQAEQIVWPTERSPYPAMKFSTEAFIHSAISEIEKQHRLDPRRIFTLSWSSGGPAGYAASLYKETRITGSLIAMSVFHQPPDSDIRLARGHAYFLLHSPDDALVPISVASRARDTLTENGAQATLVTYPGGHGWHGDLYGNLRAGIQWLEEHATLRATNSSAPPDTR
jgi:serine/threonine protein kinase/predicted esterase